MSYDLYCYRSKLGKPDEDEADAVIEADTNKWAKKEKDAATKLAIVKALTEYNPKLEAFDFEYGEIAKLTVAIIEQEKNKFGHIEINAGEDESAIRLTVYDNHVYITVPFGYKKDEARKVFDDMKSYIKIIRQTAGYFIYDPQTGRVFDPAENEFEGIDNYLRASE